MHGSRPPPDPWIYIFDYCVCRFKTQKCIRLVETERNVDACGRRWSYASGGPGSDVTVAVTLLYCGGGDVEREREREST
ncbi:hypothetical protein HanPI659440_Chr07g0276041 [Helianthus annuus]|nr:hypothetical protein HanPI659440_Chr07g0276041 [Helianthus annuus]